MIDDPARLQAQLQFLLEVDRLKLVQRQTRVLDGSRRENSAEHSWHVALMALTLLEYAEEPVDASRVIALLLVHDLVEIDAGDTFLYDAQANTDKLEREEQAATRLFSMLPEPQATQFRQLWDEFEARSTPEARFAVAVDAFQPILINHAARGGSWREHGITGRQAVERKRRDLEGFPRLWASAQELIAQTVARGDIEA